MTSTLKVLLPALFAQSLTLACAADDSVKGQAFDSKGVSIHYTIEGKGEPVILIHGLHASAQINWGAPGIIKSLAQHYQVIAMDVRGHGASGKPTEVSDYGVEMVEDVVRLMDHLKIQKAHVIGYSMGGMITMKLLTRHPERVSSAVLGGMGLLREGGPLQAFWEGLPERKSAGTPRACPRSFGELAVRDAELKAIHIPVAVVVGDRDPVKRLYVEPLESVRPDWPVTEISGAGHLNCIFKKQFKESLEHWLDQQTKKPSS